MNISTDWQKIRQHFNRSFSTNLHTSVASVDAEGNPTVTPIGSLFLNHDPSGIYFEKFPTKLPLHAKGNKKICILSVNSSNWFWIKALLKSKFTQPPAIKLYGELGSRRKATEKETAKLNKRMRLTKGLKGNTYLWGKMEFVREVTFSKVEIINLGKMTKHLEN